MFSPSNFGLCFIGEPLDGELNGFIDEGSMILFRLVCEFPPSRRFDIFRFGGCPAGECQRWNLPIGLFGFFFIGELASDVRF